MKAIGIQRVILIRSGHRRWMTYPSEVLQKYQQGFLPPVDLVRLFLDLSEKHGMEFFFGTYDSGHYWHHGEHQKEVDLSKRVVEEAWNKYGSSPAFKGWYLTQEVGRNVHGLVDILASMGRFCKQIADLPVLISPYIEGCKACDAFTSNIVTQNRISPE